MSKATLKAYIKNLIESIIEEDFPGMAAEMAFMFVLGSFPIMLVLMAIFGWLGKKSLINQVIHFMSTFAPADVVNLFQTVLKQVIIFQKGGLVAVISFIVVVFIASNAMFVIIKGLNRSYRVKETRSLIHTRILAFIMVFVNAFALFISINLIIFGRVILEFINGIMPVPTSLYNTLLIGRWPVAFLLLYAMAVINYYILPCVNFAIKKASVLPGTLFFCLMWLGGSWIFSIYVNNLQTYNRVYGTIGAFAMLMVWFYYTSLMILIGGEINSQTYNKLCKKN